MKNIKLLSFSVLLLTISCKNEIEKESIKQSFNQFNYRSDSIDILNDYKSIKDSSLNEDKIEKGLDDFAFKKIKIKVNDNNYITDTILGKLLVNIFNDKINKYPNNLSMRYSKILLGIQTENLNISKDELNYIIKNIHNSNDLKSDSKSNDKETRDKIIDKINFYNRQILAKSFPIFKEISDTLYKYNKDNVTNLILRANYFRLEKNYSEAIKSLDIADKGIEVNIKNGKIQVVNDQTDEVNFNRVVLYNDMGDKLNSTKYFNKIKNEFLKAQINMQ
jgi:uncharacterized protein YlzI (FlbEa/FlbD family)